MRKLCACLIALILASSCSLPIYAKAKKVKLNPEARAALKRNKAVQKKMKQQSKSRNREIKQLKAAR